MREDLTSKAKLRDAAITLVAEGSPVSARTVAERAGVTPGLIRHHFRSMAGLEQACDEHVARRVVESKESAIGAGLGVDVTEVIRETGEEHILGYLARRLTEGSSSIDRLVDRMAEDAVGYMARSVKAGILRPIDDLPAVARMLTVYSLGSFVLHGHLERLLGVDITDADLASQPGIARYTRVQLAIFGGLFTDEFLATVGAQLGKE